MTPARNNVRATRHFGIPARKNSPSNSPTGRKLSQQQSNPGQTAKKLAQRAPDNALSPGHESARAKKLSRHAPPTVPARKSSPSNRPILAKPRKTRPARPKTPKSSHCSRAGRTFSRFQRRTTEQGDFSPATTPLNTHHRDTTTQPPPQPVEKSPCNTCHKAQPVQNSPSNTHLTARPVQNSPGTPKNNENWPFLASRENLIPFPTRRHRAGRIFSRNNTTQHPSQGHHHPNRHKTHPATPPTTRSAGSTSQHAVQNSPSTPTSKPNRYKTLPTTPATRLNRYKTLPARPKTTKTGHFSPAGRIISRSQHRTTEQGEFSPATTPSWCLFQRS